MPGQTAALPPQPQCQPAPVRATAAPEPPKQEQKPVATAASPEASVSATPNSGEDDNDGAAFRRFDASDMEMARITEGSHQPIDWPEFHQFRRFSKYGAGEVD